MTAEQLAIVGHEPRQHAVIEAFAGTGKTSTLVRLAQAWPGYRGLYVAFNNAIARDASRSFPENVRVKTVHAYAYEALGVRRHKQRLVNGLPVSALQQALQVEVEEAGYSPKRLAASWRGALQRYLLSGAPTLSKGHFDVKQWTVDDARDLRILRRATDRLIDFETSGAAFTHDLYLKAFSRLGRVSHEFDYLMVDEAQDMNPVMIEVLRKFDRPMIVVGDPWQSIYRFRGAVSAMEMYGGKRYALTQSFRFGDSVAALANRILKRAPTAPARRVRGHPSRSTAITSSANAGERRLVLGRTNAGVLEAALKTDSTIFMQGGLGGILRLARMLTQLAATGRASATAEFPFATWRALETAASEGDPQARLLGDLHERYGATLPTIVDSLNRRHVADPSSATLWLSTAHGAKGLEMDCVEVLGDFLPPRELWNRAERRADGRALMASELADLQQEFNLLYVAVSRAKHRLLLPQPLLSYAID